MQLCNKESLKKSGLLGLKCGPWDIPVKRSNQLSWQANWELVIITYWFL